MFTDIVGIKKSTFEVMFYRNEYFWCFEYNINS